MQRLYCFSMIAIGGTIGALVCLIAYHVVVMEVVHREGCKLKAIIIFIKKSYG